LCRVAWYRQHFRGSLVVLELPEPVRRDVGEFAATRMIHRGRVPSVVTSAIEHRHTIDQFEGRQRRRRQEIPLGAVNQQDGAVDFLHRGLVRFRPRGLHAGVEHADGLDARIGAQRDREKSSAGLAHDGDLIGRDLPFQGRASTHTLFLRPIDRFSEVVRILLPALSTGLWYGPITRSRGTRSS
jgi:hypothetical protein